MNFSRPDVLLDYTVLTILYVFLQPLTLVHINFYSIFVGKKLLLLMLFVIQKCTCEIKSTV